MKENFDLFLTEVLKHEGGYADHPKDPGGATNLGITIGTLSSWLGRPATKTEVKALTVKDVAPIYRKNYWDRVRGDDLPSGVDIAVGDFAVNSGVSRSVSYLQEVVGVAPDGKIGPITMAAVRNQPPTKVIEGLCDRRLAFLRRLSTFPTFGRGWTTRVNGVRKMSVALATKATSTPVPAPDKRATTPAKTGVTPPVLGGIVAAIAAIGAALLKALGVW